MSTLLAQAVRDDDGLDLTCLLSLRDTDTDDGRAAPATRVVRTLADVPGPGSVVVDFTAREATARLLREAEATPCSLVIGTSGLTSDDRARLRDVSRCRPVVWAANFSLALTLVRRFIRDLATSVGPDWGAGVLDLHFAGKRDRPSGTGLMLADTWRDQRSASPPADLLSLRIGDAVSEHRLIAAGRGEQVEISHRVNDRAAFIPGVLAAVRFVGRAEPGLYTVEDALWA